LASVVLIHPVHSIWTTRCFATSLHCLANLEDTMLVRHRTYKQLERGPMPNVMAALPNVGGALCSTPQSLADAHYYMACSNAAKTRYQLKFAGVPQNTGPISAASGPSSPYCEDICRTYCCLVSFFRLSIRAPSCEDIARETCAMVRRWTESEFCTWQNSVRRQHIPKVYI